MPDAATKSIANIIPITAMLNINGSSMANGVNGGDNGQTNGSSTAAAAATLNAAAAVQSLYDYYKLPMVVDSVGKGGITLITSDGKTVTASDASALQEMVWSAVPVSAVSTADVLQNATIVSTSAGSLSSSPNGHSDSEERLSNTSPVLTSSNGHNSPSAQQSHQQRTNNNNNNIIKIENKNHLIVSSGENLVSSNGINGGGGVVGGNGLENGPTIIVTTTSGQRNLNSTTHQLVTRNGHTVLHPSPDNVHIKQESIPAQTTTVLHQNDQSIHIKSEPNIQTQTTIPTSTINNSTTVLHSNEVHIKSEPIDSLPPLASPAQMVDVISASVDHSRELEPSPPATVISLAPAQPYPTTGSTQLTFSAPAYDIATNGQYAVQVNAAVPPQYAVSSAAARTTNGGTVYLTTDYITYREYYPNANNGNNIVVTNDQYHTVRQHLSNATPNTNAYATTVTGAETETSYLDRYLRQQQQPTTTIAGTISASATTVSPAVAVASIPANGVVPPSGYKPTATIHGLTVDLPSPDSGIGDTTATPRPENAALPQIFEYASLPSQTPTLLPLNVTTSTDLVAGSVVTGNQVNSVANSPTITPAAVTKSSRRSWHEYGRNSDIDKIQIPKLFSDVGFKYFLESPISTSQRREDDRVTYINKGQFYGITLEYINDPDKHLKNNTVKTIIMLVFREEKTQEEEIKAWQFWHSRQHSVKQRILDADTKNSSGIVGPIEEVAHNAIAFYWNPLEGPAKVNIAVQCLSTDFSNQKGVKGLPLHLQIDTFDDIRDGSTPVHKGYCQIKVFCDKGAERKTRDEERRAAKRKMNATGNGRKKIEEMYHPSCDRSEFYSMSDLLKPPVLFTPSEDMEKITTGDINFYGHSSSDIGYDADSSAINISSINTSLPITTLHPCDRNDSLVCEIPIQCPPKKIKLERYPSISERVLLFAKQENEEVFHPLHLVPPTLVGLALAIENKYKLEAKNIRNIYKRCKKGITVQMDDDMVKHYSHEDTVLLEVHQIDSETHDITLVEYEGH